MPVGGAPHPPSPPAVPAPPAAPVTPFAEECSIRQERELPPPPKLPQRLPQRRRAPRALKLQLEARIGRANITSSDDDMSSMCSTPVASRSPARSRSASRSAVPATAVQAALDLGFPVVLNDGSDRDDRKSRALKISPAEEARQARRKLEVAKRVKDPTEGGTSRKNWGDRAFWACCVARDVQACWA